MKQLALSRLELRAETHDELVHMMCLIMKTTTGIELRTCKKLSSIDSAVERCESVNLTLKPTILTAEPIDSVLPLLETSKGLYKV